MKEQEKSVYRPRWLLDLLAKCVRDTPVTVLSGARQVGKSTFLLEEVAASWRYSTLDNLDALTQVRRDPRAFLATGRSTIIDEVQRAPELLSEIKRRVDLDSSCRFILSGSANLLLMARVSETLAGRAEYLQLGPLTIGEMRARTPASILQAGLDGCVPEPHSPCEILDLDALSDLVWQGGMPVVLHRTGDSLLRWRDGYVETYLERDLRQLSQIENLTDFRRVMTALALRNGQILNTSELARDVGISQPTAHRYLNLLEVSGLMHKLPAFSLNRGVRLAKRPKVMWRDSGIACHLAGCFSANDARKAREWGGLLESFVFEQISGLAELLTPRPRTYYWRTRAGQEVDLIVEQGRKLLAIEIKAAQQVRYADTVALQMFLNTYPETGLGLVLYGGKELVSLADKLVAVPISALW